jgi:MFS family permease
LGKLHLGNGGAGILFGMWGAGGVLGSVALLALVRRRGFGLALSVGAIGFGIGLAAAGLDGPALAILAMIPAGVGFALVETAVMGLVPRLADDAVVGRVYALSEILYAGAAGVGALVAAPLIAAFGSAGSLVIVGLAFALLSTLTLRRTAALDAGQEQARKIRDLLRRVPLISPLPLPRLERLVRGAIRAEFASGETIIRRGEPGEEYFVIEDGTVDIVEYGRRQGPGQGFGEIALLRDVPRTATVRAASAVRLWKLTRPAFIAAVSEHADALGLADQLIVEHLSRPQVTDG